jgi:nucleotide-binding universal stress UspA family protein
MVHITNILYPTDFSSFSNHAYFHAITLAETHDATLTIAHVYRPDSGRDRAFWREQLEAIRPWNSNLEVKHVFLEGDPSTEIIRLATSKGIDMIVMGTHGRTATDESLLGSVAERVLGGAPCSVMVVKLPRAVTVPKPILVDAG